MLTKNKILLILVIIIFIFIFINKTEKFTNNTCVSGNCKDLFEMCEKNEECKSNICFKNPNNNIGKCIDHECISLFDCKNNERCIAGKCIPRLNINEICNSNSDCITDRCLRDKNASRGLCLNKIPENCNINNNCDCTYNNECETGLCYNNKCCRPGDYGCMCTQNRKCATNDKFPVECIKSKLTNIYECDTP